MNFLPAAVEYVLCPCFQPSGQFFVTTYSVRIEASFHACLQEQEARLPSLIKMIVWAQQQLDDKVVYPKIKDFATAKLVEQPE